MTAMYRSKDTRASQTVSVVALLILAGVLLLDLPIFNRQIVAPSFLTPSVNASSSALGPDSGFVSKRDVDIGDSEAYRATYGSVRPDARRWILYNKPWKTGSTSIANLLGGCCGMKGYREVQFKWLESDDVINPVTPALEFAEGDKLVSVMHGRYNIAELRDLKHRDTYKTCYITSVRDPMERVPSNALQLMEGSINTGSDYKIPPEEMQRLVCEGLKETSPQFMIHYMVGMQWNREINLTTEQTQYLANEIVATYDIILDKTGRTLYDSKSPFCDVARQCLISQPDKLNSKLGDITANYACKEELQRLIEEENKFYAQVLKEIDRRSALHA